MEVQGKVQYGSAASTGAGVLGARNGLSVDAVTDAVLGQDFNQAGNPAVLLNTRQIPMNQNIIGFNLDANPKDYFWINADSCVTEWESAAASLWSIWTPSNYQTVYTPGGTANRFYSGYSVNPGVNPGPRPNVVGMWWGYNTDYQQGRIDLTEPAFRYATETYFVIGADDSFEFHTPEMTTTTGTIFRLDSTYVARQTGVGFREIAIDDITTFSTGFPVSTGQFYSHLQYNPVADTSTFTLASQLAGGVASLRLGNWTDGLSSTFIDAQSGLMNIVALVDIDLRSARVIMDSTSYGNIVNPTVSSANNTDSPIGDEMFGIQSTSKGFRLPSMTTAQRTAIATIAVGGLMVFDNTIGKAYLWTGVAWQQIQSV